MSLRNRTMIEQFVGSTRVQIGEETWHVVWSEDQAVTAEQAMLVIGRKVSGGTRSAQGSTIRMVLASLAATARLRTLDRTATFLHVLTDPSHAL